jgi:23S rRNA pseudouridine1911/1915/1917 synthase
VSEAAEVRWNRDLLLPGGKVDPEAVRRALDDAGEDDVDARRVRLTLQRDVGARLDKYLTSRITFMSRTQLARLIEAGEVTVNARQAKASTTLRLGDVVDVIVPAPTPTEIQPEPIELDALFEDEHLIVLNKQADIIVHPARSHNRGTMLHALAWRFTHESGGELSPVGRDLARPGVVHRLDRDTTGCIVFAKSEEAHWKLAVQFERREVDKRYLAVTHGLVEPDGQVIDLPLGPHPSKEKGYREKRVVRYDDLGKPSVTICRVRERYRRPGGESGGTAGAQEGAEAFSLVELELRTGRTHQIRVHLSHLGWPIVGDDMYGGRPLEVGAGAVMSRQALHAALLGFRHPITGEDLSFVAPLAPDMRALTEHLRAGEVEPVDVEQTIPLRRLGL